jgi:hypothetical protein
MVWQPAEGGEAVSAEAWSMSVDEDAQGHEPDADAIIDETAASEVSGDGGGAP